MAYKTFASINIAVIGDGKVGEALAKGLAYAEHNIFVGIKNEFTKIPEDIFHEFGNIALTSIEYAAAVADVIFITTPASEVREAAYLLDDVRHKIIVDMSGFSSSFDDYFHTTNAIHTITSSPNVVKCYSDKGYSDLVDLFVPGRRREIYVAGDNRKSKEVVKLLMRDFGFAHCYDFGGHESITLLDEKMMLAGSIASKKNKVGVDAKQ